MSKEGGSAKRGSRLRRLLSGPLRSTAGARQSPPDTEAADRDFLCTRICDCVEGPQGRPVVRVSGTLHAVRERTVAGMPALQAELNDGSASLDVVWLGRRSIAGVEPGRVMVASGRVATTRGRPVLFNPRYELQPRGQE